MSAPRSNRVEASVLRPRRLLVRRTDAGLKYALSKTTVFVVAEILRVRSAHHARDSLRPIAVGDDQHFGIERARDAVERRDRLAGVARGVRESPRPASFAVIERVHRLAGSPRFT